MWPPSIWVVKKSVGWKLWEGVLIVAVTNFVGFKTSSSRQQLPALSSIKVEFCWWTMLHLFCHLPNIEDFHTKKFGNQMEHKLFNVFLALVKCHILNWSKTSGSDSWISEFGGNLFSSLCSILDVKKYLAEYSDLHLIFTFLLTKALAYISSASVYISLYLDRRLNMVPWHSQEFVKW